MLIFCVSNLHLYYAHEVRSYTLVSLLVVASFYLFLEILHKPNWSKTIFLIVINTLLLYTHLTSILIFAAQGLYMVFHLKVPKKLLHAGPSFLIPLLLLSVWLFNNSWFVGSETTWLPVPDIRMFFNMYVGFFNNTNNSIFLGILLLLSFIFYIIKNKEPVSIEKYTKKALFLLFWAVVPVAIMYIASIYYNPRFIPRYMLYASIGAYLLVPYISSHNRFPHSIKILLLGLFIIFSGLSLNLNPYKGENWKQAINYYSEIKTDNSLTIVSAWYQWMTFSYYYKPEYFIKYDDTNQLLDVFSKENISFANSQRVLNHISLENKQKIFLVLSHYEVVDPNRNLLNYFKDNFKETEESRSFTGVNVLVFEPKD